MNADADSDFDGIPDYEDINTGHDSDFDGIEDYDDLYFDDPVMDNFERNMESLNNNW